MNMNIWNLSQTKTSYFIRERTEAQKRHLNTLKKTKSKLDFKNTAYNSEKLQKLNQSCFRTQININIPKENRHTSNHQTPDESLLNAVCVDKSREKSVSLSSSYVANLRVSSSLSRIKYNKQIDKQNSQLFQRLIKTKPSISEIQLKKNYLRNLKYKQNLLKNKYINPDYTNEVKQVKKSPVHLRLKPIQNFQKSSAKINQRIKSQIQQSKIELKYVCEHKKNSSGLE